MRGQNSSLFFLCYVSINQAVQSLCSSDLSSLSLALLCRFIFLLHLLSFGKHTQFSVLIPQTAETASRLLSTDVPMSGAFEGREIKTNGLSMNMTIEMCHTKIYVNMKYVFQK
jgi:hypothetical protein